MNLQFIFVRLGGDVYVNTGKMSVFVENLLKQNQDSIQEMSI